MTTTRLEQVEERERLGRQGPTIIHERPEEILAECRWARDVCEYLAEQLDGDEDCFCYDAYDGHVTCAGCRIRRLLKAVEVGP